MDSTNGFEVNYDTDDDINDGTTTISYFDLLTRGGAATAPAHYIRFIRVSGTRWLVESEGATWQTS